MGTAQRLYVGAHARCVTFIRSQVRWSVRVLEQDEQNGQIVRPWSSPFDKSLIFQLQAKTNLLRLANICHCSLVIAFPFAKVLPAIAPALVAERPLRSRLLTKGLPMDLSIKSFRYNASLEQVQVGLAGDLGQGLFQVAIHFPFRIGEGPAREIRRSALLQAQQILQTAASTSLPSLLTADVPQRAPTPTSSITSPMSPWCRRTA